MAESSKLLTKLMDDVVHRPSKVRASDVADLTLDELAIYMKFLAKRTPELKVGVEKK